MRHRLFRGIALCLCIAGLAMSLLGGDASVMAGAVEYHGAASYESSVFYTRLREVQLTGDARTDLVQIARSQVGYREGTNENDLSGAVDGGGNCTEYGRWYGMQSLWCAMFVSWCAELSGTSSVIPRHAYTPSGLGWFRTRGRVCSRAAVAGGVYEPQSGDIIYFKSNRNTNPTNHVGIVTGYENGTVFTIEGNSNEFPTDADCGGVVAKSRSIYDPAIVFICRPDYPSSDGSSSALPVCAQQVQPSCTARRHVGFRGE